MIPHTQFTKSGHTVRQTKSGSQTGSSLIYVIILITVVAALAAGVLSLTTSTTRDEMTFNFRNRAKFLAEGGLNYFSAKSYEMLSSYLEEGESNATARAAVVSELNGKVVSVEGKGTFTLEVADNAGAGASYADPFDVVSTGEAGSGMALSRFRIGRDMVANVGGTNPYDPDAWRIVASNYDPSNPEQSVLYVDSDRESLHVGNLYYQSYGAAWYTGNLYGTSQTYTSDGLREFGAGLRAYHDFYYDSGSWGDGHTFAVVNGDVNTFDDSGGDPSMGELIAYGGYGVNGDGLQPPKLGNEFDIYWNTNGSNICVAGSRSDNCTTYVDRWGRTQFSCSSSNHHHIALVYWGNDNNTCTGKPIGAQNTYDDNRHWQTNVSGPYNMGKGETAANGDVGYYHVGNLVDGDTHSYRIEIDRATSPNGSGNYEYVIKTWLDCTNCNDVSIPFTGNDGNGDSYTLVQHVELTAAQHAMMDEVLVGFTIATGGATQDAIIQNFELYMIEE